MNLRAYIAPVLLLLVVLALHARVQAQSPAVPDYRAVDAHAIAAPASVQNSFASLAAYLEGPCRSDEEKARAIYRWITANIRYDVEAFLSGKQMSGNATDALKSRRGVCEGYAGLFMELAKASGIKAAKINGYAKGYGYVPGRALGEVPNHSWNAVSIDGKWRLLDCTWGAGYIGDDRKFHRAFDSHFFFTPPQDFIFDHLPEKAEWQLLDPAWSREQFERTAYVKPDLFNLGLSLGGNTLSTIRADGEVLIRLGMTEAVAGVAALFKGVRSTDDRYAFVQSESNALVVRVTPPDTGKYTLRIFARAVADTGIYPWILDYTIESSRLLKRFPPYPRKYRAFDDQKARLIEPLTGLLFNGTVQTFRLKIPWAAQAAVVIDGDWTYLERDGEELKAEVRIHPGRVSVCAKYPDHEKWDTLLEFTGK